MSMSAAQCSYIRRVYSLNTRYFLTWNSDLCWCLSVSCAYAVPCARFQLPDVLTPQIPPLPIPLWTLIRTPQAHQLRANPHLSYFDFGSVPDAAVPTSCLSDMIPSPVDCNANWRPSMPRQTRPSGTKARWSCGCTRRVLPVFDTSILVEYRPVDR